VVGVVREYRNGKYQHNCDIQPSLMYKELGYTRQYEQLQLDFDSLASSCQEQADYTYSTAGNSVGRGTPAQTV
jgi:hypothetical protein